MAVSLNTALGAYPIAALAGTNYVPLAGGTMTGALTISNGATTVLSADLSGYLRVGGVTTFEHKGLTASTGLLISSTSGYQIVRAYAFVDINNAACIGDTGRGDLGVSLGSERALQWSSSSVAHSATADIYLYRDAAATLAQRNGTNQQSFSVYNTYTDSSNYERLKLTGVAGTSVNITAETLGTGGDNLDIVLTPAGTGRVDQINGTTAQTFRVFNTYTNSSNGEWGALEWNSNRLYVRTNINGTGVARSIQLDAVGAAAVYLGINGGWKWGMNTSAGTYDFSPDTTNSYDIGLTAKRVRSVYVGTATVNAGYAEHAEMTAPSAPATNSVRIYAEDNGSGKTRLMALFATGAAQQIAIEP